MKKISVYVKGDRNSTDYYRIYQYLDKLDNKDYKCVYHVQMDGKSYQKWMPVSNKPIYIKIVVYLSIYFRRLFDLMRDWLNPPQILVLHRGLIGRYVPYSFRFLLKRITARGTRLIWDYDDHIIANGEVPQAVFNECAELASHILVTHDFLKALLPPSCQHKAIIIPTTDGDMYPLYSKELNKTRLEQLRKNVILVWVATKRNLRFLKPVMPALDKAARTLMELDGRKLKLKVICNAPLEGEYENIIVENIPWTRERAIHGMMESHIGIMPLIDSEITRGKGGFKLIQYLSIGLPCIGSDVGYNKTVISSECGSLVKDERGWEDAIMRFSNLSLWQIYSESAFRHWNENFSFEKNLYTWKQIIKSIK